MSRRFSLATRAMAYHELLEYSGPLSRASMKEEKSISK